MMPDTYSCECPENLSGRNCDETELNGFKYLIVDEPQDWEAARESCVERGYQLTSIETEQEIEFLSSFVGYYKLYVRSYLNITLASYNIFLSITQVFH